MIRIGYPCLLGAEGFEPSKTYVNGFTARPLWPLGYTPIDGPGMSWTYPDHRITSRTLYSKKSLLPSAASPRRPMRKAMGGTPIPYCLLRFEYHRCATGRLYRRSGGLQQKIKQTKHQRQDKSRRYDKQIGHRRNLPIVGDTDRLRGLCPSGQTFRPCQKPQPVSNRRQGRWFAGRRAESPRTEPLRRGRDGAIRR